MSAIQNANADVGAMVMELSEREYMVRGLGYLKSLARHRERRGRRHARTARRSGWPSWAGCAVGPAVRRGVAELDGRGDAVGGIVMMRFGENALTTITQREGASWRRSRPGCRPAWSCAPGLRPQRPHRARHRDAARTSCSRRASSSRSCASCSCCTRSSALVAILTLPVGILMAFIAMRGRARRGRHHVARRHRHRDRRDDRRRDRHDREHAQAPRARDRCAKEPARTTRPASRIDTSVLTTAERWRVVVESAQEVGPALFFSLLIITVVLPAGLHARGTGGTAVQAARVHQDLLDGGRQPALGDARAGRHGAVHPRAPLPRAREPDQPGAHPRSTGPSSRSCSGTGGR